MDRESYAEVYSARKAEIDRSATAVVVSTTSVAQLERRLPPEFEIALFRIGQEVMNNIARHAGAESVLIQLGPHAAGAGAPRELRIEIEDDGQGFDPAATREDRPHYGLLGIRERAELLGGVATIESAPGDGTRVEVRVPLPADGAASQAPAVTLSSGEP